MKKTKSQRFALLVTISVGILFISVFIYQSYHSSVLNVAQTNQKQLNGIVFTLASAIDGDEYEEILNTFATKDEISANEDDVNYSKIHNLLANAQKRNSLQSDLHILSKNSDAKAADPAKAFFIAISSGEPVFRHLYHNPPTELYGLYNTGGSINAHSNDSGTWVSAAAPIINSQGKVVGLVKADAKADTLLGGGTSKSNKYLFYLGALCFAVMVISFLIIFYITKKILATQKNVIESSRQATSTYDDLSSFADDIGKGIFDGDARKIKAQENSLAKALLEMREKLQSSAETQNRLNWSVKGQADFSELLLQHTENIMDLSAACIAYIANYLNAQQGAIYVHKEEGDNKFLELCGHYGLSEERSLESRIELGQSIVGQCFLEQSHILLANVPTSYGKIESGLGEAVPLQVLAVPLMHFGEPRGVIEVMSLKPFSEHEIKFVNEVGLSIGASVVLVSQNTRNASMLVESEKMTQQLQMQEEEMRQNSEELQATQEEMERRIKELESQASK